MIDEQGRTYVQRRWDRKRNELTHKKRLAEEIKTLRFNKALSKYLEIVKQKDTKKLNKDDWNEISKVYYNNITNYNRIRLKRLFMSEEVQKIANSKLIDLYNDSGLSLDDAKKLLELAKKAAIEKKDVANLIKLAEKIEKAHNLVDNSRVNVSQTQIIDYSKVDEAGNPAIKEVKKIEKVVSQDGITEQDTSSLDKNAEKTG